MGFEARGTGMPVPLSVFWQGAYAMTLSEDAVAQTSQPQSVPILKTERLTLRAPCRDDARIIAKLANDRRIAENTLRIPHPYGTGDAEQFIATVNAGDGETCFVAMLDGTPIGVCGLVPREDGAEIGYWLGVAYWGRGFATEAARAVIDHAFGDLDHDTLQSGARVSNPASRRVLEKCGFQWTGVRLCRIRAISSAAPIDRFRLDRGLWASLKSWGKVKRVA
jgi:RimJ/RimL family protein N-acetyltransferase